MKRIHLLVFALVFTMASGAIAHWLDVASLLPTTAAYNLYNPNIRGPDGKLVASRLSTAPQIGEITLDDGSGEAFTTPTSATVIKSATLTLAGGIRGSVVVTPADGSVTVKKSGLYEVQFCVGDGVGANTATVQASVFEKVGAASAAELTQAIKAVTITLTAQPWVPLCATGLVTVTAAEAAATGNVIFDVRAIASTGNLTVKQFRFSVKKVDELDPPTPNG